jgi:hypothetical protein
MKKMVSFAATVEEVVRNRSMEIVQPTYTQSSETAHVRYIDRRLNRRTTKERLTAVKRFQHVQLTLIFPLKFGSV